MKIENRKEQKLVKYHFSSLSEYAYQVQRVIYILVGAFRCSTLISLKSNISDNVLKLDRPL